MASKRGRTTPIERPVARGSADGGLVDIEWVAMRLGVTVRHVRRLVAERRIPRVKWGHLLRFDPAEIDAWVDEAHQPQAR